MGVCDCLAASVWCAADNEHHMHRLSSHLSGEVACHDNSARVCMRAGAGAMLLLLPMYLRDGLWNDECMHAMNEAVLRSQCVCTSVHRYGQSSFSLQNM